MFDVVLTPVLAKLRAVCFIPAGAMWCSMALADGPVGSFALGAPCLEFGRLGPDVLRDEKIFLIDDAQGDLAFEITSSHPEIVALVLCALNEPHPIPGPAW